MVGSSRASQMHVDRHKPGKSEGTIKVDSSLIFVDEQDIDAMAYLGRLAQSFSRIERRSTEFIVDGSMALKQVRGMATAIDVYMATERYCT